LINLFTDSSRRKKRLRQTCFLVLPAYPTIAIQAGQVFQSAAKKSCGRNPCAGYRLSVRLKNNATSGTNRQVAEKVAKC
jgi:hypothetical protein